MKGFEDDTAPPAERFDSILERALNAAAVQRNRTTSAQYFPNDNFEQTSLLQSTICSSPPTPRTRWKNKIVVDNTSHYAIVCSRQVHSQCFQS